MFELSLYHEFLSLIVPFHCVRCGREDTQLCEECANDLLFAAPECLYCGNTSHYGATHRYCRQRSAHFDNFVSCFRYHPVLKYILRAYKYSNEKVLFTVIGKLLQEYSQYDPFLSLSLFRGKKVLVIPIPMHRNKLRERGYSVSLSIAEIFKKIGKNIFEACTISEEIVIKNKETIAQAKVKKARRFVQQLGVFEIAPNANKIISTVNPQIIVIVDDVVSTGATAQSVLEAIKKQLSINNTVKFVLFSFARS